ncbi:MAG TPA: hypothetical protein VMD74_02180 [Candidatus Methylomirabilis sp.]|nr:hypothetical protein [Candidatus Methylomirabilis sp.]HTW96448.1 hypothetical protein [Candidatus Methylomirabilis sp.]
MNFQVFRSIFKMNENGAAVVWLLFGLCVLAGLVAVYLTPLASRFGA